MQRKFLFKFLMVVMLLTFAAPTLLVSLPAQAAGGAMDPNGAP